MRNNAISVAERPVFGGVILREVFAVLYEPAAVIQSYERNAEMENKADKGRVRAIL